MGHGVCVWELFLFYLIAARAPLSNSGPFSFCSCVLSSAPMPTGASIHISSGNIQNMAVQNSICMNGLGLWEAVWEHAHLGE